LHFAFAFADVTSALTFLHGVVAIVVWLRFNIAIIMLSSQRLDCLILFWFFPSESLRKCVFLFVFVHHGLFFFFGAFKQVCHFCKILTFVAFKLIFFLAIIVTKLGSIVCVMC
jgi:hypothetical protein